MTKTSSCLNNNARNDNEEEKNNEDAKTISVSKNFSAKDKKIMLYMTMTLSDKAIKVLNRLW